MIIGNGDLAKVITDKEDCIFFASGVSNSLENRLTEFEREYNLLMAQDKSKRLVYFSSLSIYYKESDYTNHKLFMEFVIKKHFAKYCIIRLGNITWGENPNTIINYFKKKIKESEIPEIQDGYRYVCTQYEFNHWLNLIPKFNTEMNITGSLTSIRDLYSSLT